MAKKKTQPKETEAKESNIKPGSKPLRSAKRELFCYLYMGHHNRYLFNNATRSYMHAYGHNERIDALQDELQAILDSKEEGYTVAEKQVRERIRKVERMCQAEGSFLLSNPMIQERCDYLLDELINNDFVDRELVKVILQNSDLSSKVRAIAEYNKVRDRGGNKLEGEFTFRWADPEEAGEPA